MQPSQLVTSRRIGLCLALMAGLLVGAIALTSMSGIVAAQGPAPQAPQALTGTGFTYQGELKKSNAPVSDNSCGMTFTLWDSQSSGTGQVGGSQLITPVTVANGLFTVYVNGGGQFGLNAFDGSDRWLQAAVQCAGDGSPVTLSRQRLSAAPYAFALPGLWIQRNVNSPNIIGGHISNTIVSSSFGSVIGGGGGVGNSNSIDGSDSVIAGGSRNAINTDDSFIGGGFSNTVTPAAHEGTIGGGGNNSVSGDHAAIFAGLSNATFGDESFVGGGSNNVAAAASSTVGGGSSNLANGAYAFIGGGSNNLITGTSSADGAVIGGGSQNIISATTFGDFSTIAGGGANAIRGGDIRYNTIGGGSGNNVAGSLGYATIGGGSSNSVTAQGGTIPGGFGNEAAGFWSFAAGTLAKAKHDQSFVWNDDGITEFDSTGSRQFLIHATGGVGLGTNAPATQLHVVKSANGSGTNPGDNVAVIENTNTNNSADVLALKIGGTVTPSMSNNFVTFLLGNNLSAGALQGNGFGGIELAGPGNDYAEWLPRLNAAEAIAPGEIVGVFAGRISKQTRGAAQVMVVSTGPIVAGNDPGESARAGYAPVAFIGQAMARVRGAVRAGDFIVPSGLDDGAGIAIGPEAISAEQFAQVVGQAWESSADESGPRPVRIVVGLIRNDPTVQRLVAQSRAQTAQIEQLQQQNAALDARLSALEQNAQHGPATLAGMGTFAPEWLIGAGLLFAGMIAARRLGVKI